MTGRVTMRDVLSGRVDISRLEDRRGWLGARRMDPAEMDPSWTSGDSPTQPRNRRGRD